MSVYNSFFKNGRSGVGLLSSCHSQQWKSKKVNSPRRKIITVKRETDNKA